MTDRRRFIAGRRLTGLDVVSIGGQAVIDRYPQLREVLRLRCGPDAARLLAEPVLSGGNGSSSARVDWYCDQEGAVSALADLDGERAARVRGQAAALVERISSLFYDPEIGAFVAAAFNVSGPEALLVVGEEPVLVDWGLLPAGLASDEVARSRHVETTLNSLLGTALPLPPVSDAEWASRFRRPGSAAHASLPEQAARRSTSSRALRVVPWAALAVSALLLTLSFWPDVLQFPSNTGARVADELAGSVIGGLRQRQATLGAAADLDCERLAIELPRLVPQRPAAVRAAPGLRDGGPAALFDPGSDRPEAASNSARTVGAQPAAAAPDDLAARLTAATVLVIAGEATGSGFFVANDLVVTNRHVVEGARQVVVAGPSISILRAADVRASPGGELGDFALIRVPPQPGVRPLALAAPQAALTPVVSTGFPGLQLATDPVFGRLREGDATAARDLAPVFGTGVVNHLQRYPDNGVTLVLHGAEIAPGSSGGPLTDYCGRVIGVNTFLRTDATLPVTVRYALGSDGLAAFLASSGSSVPLDGARCDLHGASATPSQPQPSPARRPEAAPAPAPAPAR